MTQPFIVKPGEKIGLSGVENDCNPEHIPDYTGAYRKKGETKKPLKKTE